MNYNKRNIRLLLSKYAKNQLSHEELKALQDSVNNLTDKELYDDLYAEWGKYEMPNKHYGKRRQIIGIWSAVAASVIIFILASVLIEHRNSGSELEQIAVSMENTLHQTKEIQLILDTEKAVEIERGATVEYQKDGVVYVDKKEVENTPRQEVNSGKYNRLLVPKGKYTHVILSDGTTMYVNAGTKVVYPTFFQKKEREIFVDGEVFLDVAPNKHAPFIVKTINFDVQVLGTTFNVNAYSDNTEEKEVVLAKGKVKVINKSGNDQLMQPNEKMTISENGNMIKSAVDANEYMLWTKGILSLKDEPLHVISTRLSRYYGVDIKCHDEISSISISGKIDLEHSIDEVLNDLSIIGSFSYFKQNEVYMLTPKIQ